MAGKIEVRSGCVLLLLLCVSVLGVSSGGNRTEPLSTSPGALLQSEKSTDFMVVKKKDGFKKKFLVKASHEAPEEELEEELAVPAEEEEEFMKQLDRMLNATRNVEKRRKRQSDSAAEVVGLRLTQEAQAGSYNELKAGARRTVRRAKRSLSFSWSKSLEFSPRNYFRFRRRLSSTAPRYGPPGHYPSAPIITSYAPAPVTWAVQGLMTMTQRIWNAINHNYDLARRFLLSNPVQSNNVNTRLVVTNPQGVTCNDVCDPEGNGYGTIGICTEKFCKCDFHTWTFTRYDCPRDCVFDPLRLVCDYPQNVILCNDEDDYYDDSRDNQVQYSYGWSSGGYSKK